MSDRAVIRNFLRALLVCLLIAALSGSRTALYILVASAFYFALKRTVGDWGRDATETPNVFCLWGSIAVALALILATEKYGTKRPGSFFERSEYEARLYVHLYPEAQKVTSYRVPAMISAEGGEYWLWSAFMPKGVRIDFNDCRVKLQETVHCFNFDDTTSVKLQETVTCFDFDDTSGRRWEDWGVVLTPTPAIGAP